MDVPVKRHLILTHEPETNMKIQGKFIFPHFSYRHPLPIRPDEVSNRLVRSLVPNLKTATIAYVEKYTVCQACNLTVWCMKSR